MKHLTEKAKQKDLNYWLACGWLLLVILMSTCQPNMVSFPSSSSTPQAESPTVASPTLPQTNTESVVTATQRILTDTPSPPTATTAATPVSFSPTPAPVLPTVLPGLELAQDLANVVILKDYAGLWSPAFDEMVSIYPFAPNLPGGHDITLATAPSFKLRPFNLGITFYSTTFLWNLYGERLFFAGPPPGEDSYGVDQGYGGLWSIDRKGKDLRPLENDWQQDLPEFVGWMNDTWLVAKHYVGGGHWHVSMINSQTGETAGWAIIHGLVYPPNRRFVPAADEMGGQYRMHVITSDYQATPAALMESGEFARSIPWDSLRSLVSLPGDFSLVGSIFKGWKPRSNQMLVYGFESLAGEDHTARLLVWDVETDDLKDLLPNGVDGGYSPDGQWLAAVSLGAVTLDEAGKPQLSPPRAVDTSSQAYLYIFQTRTGQVKFSLPTAVLPEEMEFGDYPGYIAHLAFSPNSSYLAFLAPAGLELDAQGKPSKLLANDGNLYLNVLDLNTGSVIFSSPTNAMMRPVWSPNNSFLAFADANANLNVFDLSNLSSRSLTLAGGQNISRVAWSQSSSYLSMVVGDFYSADTVIVTIP